MKWKRFLGTLCCHKAVFLRGVTSTLNSFYATKRQPLLFFNEKCGLASLNDTRRAPEISTFDVVNSLLHAALLRIPSLNALEGDLKESDFQKLIGRTPTPDAKAFSADVVANVLDQLQLGG